MALRSLLRAVIWVTHHRGREDVIGLRREERLVREIDLISQKTAKERRRESTQSPRDAREIAQRKTALQEVVQPLQGTKTLWMRWHQQPSLTRMRILMPAISVMVKLSD